MTEKPQAEKASKEGANKMNYKLGRRPARHSLRSLWRGEVLYRHLRNLGPAPAASPDWVSAVMKQSTAGWTMQGNDQFGDCVFADCAHQEMLRTANVGTIWIPEVADVLAFYSAVTGFNPSDPNTDNGADELTVIEYLTTSGWLGRKLDAHADINPAHLELVKWAVCLFGACRLGVNLPASAMDQFQAGKPWDYVAGSPLDGGHDVPVVLYKDGSGGINSALLLIVSWGQLVEVTPAFMAAKYDDGTPYVEEAHAELAFDWIRAVGTAPSNLNLDQLQQDLAFG
jgi:hypothetical protein